MKTLRYSPSVVPSTLPALLSWLGREFRSVSHGLQAVLDIEVSREAPAVPLRGMVRYACGAPGWDPGSGEGLYVYAGTPPAWKKMHA
jgi:hypothetical protein